jgi:hypothetical protein
MKNWKSPKILRLSRIEKWAKARFERRMQEGDIAPSMRAANFYTIISHRCDGIALGTVSSYR